MDVNGHETIQLDINTQINDNHLSPDLNWVCYKIVYYLFYNLSLSSLLIDIILLNINKNTSNMNVIIIITLV
jgi:hypothetical protein